MVRVRALKAFESVSDGAIGRPRREGEEWECHPDRAAWLVLNKVAEYVPEDEQDIIVEKPKRGRKKKES